MKLLVLAEILIVVETLVTLTFLVLTNGPVFSRGGPAYNGGGAGVFAFLNYGKGDGHNGCSFRPVVLSSQP